MALDQKQVEIKGKELSKAANAGEGASTLLPRLEELRKGVHATEELLRSTKIGMIVNRLKSHPDNAVKIKAAEIVSRWRADVKKATPSGASTPRPAHNGTSSPAPVASPVAPVKEKRKHNVPPEKRNVKEDKVDWEVTGNKMRDNAVRMMYDGLAFMSEELPDDVLKVARDVELAAFNAFQPETSTRYKSKVRSLYMNLKNKSNPQLRVRVLAGKIAPADFVTMKDEEMRSEEQKAADRALMKENMNKAMVAQEEKSVSAQLKCGKCGMRKVSYSQAQTRSADEPMTTFCECLNCGNRWKFS